MRWAWVLFLAACSGERAEAGADALADADSGALADADADADADVVERACVTVARSGGSVDDSLGTASVEVSGPDCARTYRLSSTAARRDGEPASPREVVEAANDPLLRSGNDLIDGLYALALDEARANAVSGVKDGAMTGDQTLACAAPGCWQTGELWSYVWTRDTAYAIELGLAPIDPARAAASLLFKVSGRRAAGGNPGTQIVQDTGSGGSYPVSTDRVVWALAAESLGDALDPATTFDVVRNTLEHDRRVIFDAATGLYRGEQSFLDWREQSYPAHTANDVSDIADGIALSTNVLHYRALRFAADLAERVAGHSAHERYAGWAEALAQAIRERLWLDDVGLFATLLPTTLDRAPVHRYDLLGEALAVVSGIATPAQAERIVASYPHIGGRAPVIWPQQQLTPIYHNRATWPFVTAYWLRAARIADNGTVGAAAFDELVRAAALNLSNMESLEVASGAPWVDDGAYSGPVLSSRRQLWSVGGFLAMVQRVLFGLEPTRTGLVLRPWVPAAIRERWFTNATELVLNDYPHHGRRLTIVLKLPAEPGDVYSADLAFEDADLPERIDVDLHATGRAGSMTTRSDDDWRDVFGPRTPEITLAREGTTMRVFLGTGGDAAADLTFHVYRDDVFWKDVAGTSTSVVDDAPGRCYSVDTSFASGTRSQRARAVCAWAADAIQTVLASALTAVGGEPIDQYGRFHYQAWGDPGDSLTAAGFRPNASGAHLLQVEYGNGAGSISSGITCGVKRVMVTEETSGAVVGDGFLVMPQLGTWDRWAYSTFVPVTLDVAKTYRIAIVADPLAVNMSSFALFSTFSGTGGVSPFDHVNIAELRVLRR